MSLEPRQLADWLGILLEFLESRQADVAVQVHPSREPGRTLLLTNTPDAPFLLDTVQSLLAADGVRFQVVSHPILAVARRRGVVVGLGGPDQEGERVV